MNPLIPAGMIEGWKIVRPDLRARNGYRWPWPGNWAEAHNIYHHNRGACPKRDGDGLCVAKTWKGAASGGHHAVTALLLAYRGEAVLGEDDDKVRVERCLVLDVFDPQQLIRDGWCRGADLSGADLRMADLHGADLHGADLYKADLYGADLYGADLYGADLRRADLRRADLRRADLRRADLYGADLYGADLEALKQRGAIL